MLLSDSIRNQTAARLKALPNPVRLVVFTQEMECRFCGENRQLAEELSALSDKVKLEVYNLVTDAEKAKEFAVDKVPAVCVVGAKDYGIRFYGVRLGFEFSSLVAAIELVSDGDPHLKPETLQKLAGLAGPVELQVFATLTCPVCPLAVNLAHRLALASEKVTASVIDSAEFPQLANLYNVMAVPKTVVNKRHAFEGALPEDRFVEEVLKGTAASGT